MESGVPNSQALCKKKIIFSSRPNTKVSNLTPRALLEHSPGLFVLFVFAEVMFQ